MGQEITNVIKFLKRHHAETKEVEGKELFVFAAASLEGDKIAGIMHGECSNELIANAILQLFQLDPQIKQAVLAYLMEETAALLLAGTKDNTIQ